LEIVGGEFMKYFLGSDTCRFSINVKLINVGIENMGGFNFFEKPDL